MKEAMKVVLRALAIGVVCSLLGYLLAGCDGDEDAGLGDAGVAAGKDTGDDTISLRRTDAGTIFCDVPSPTGDQPSGYGAAARDLPATNFILATNDVAKVCEDMKAVYPSLPKQVGAPSDSVVAGIDCKDVAHDFQGSSGISWSVSIVAPDGFSSCNATAMSDSCLANGLSPMLKYPSGHAQGLFIRSWALCGVSGLFVGWAYTSS